VNEAMKLYLMKVGAIRPPHKPKAEELPVPAYLIETREREYILVDTGFSQRFAGTYRDNPNFPYIMDGSDYVGEQLSALGLTQQDIRYVICTHFDPDHAGNLAIFKQAQIVVQRRMYQAAIKGGLERFEKTRNQWDADGLRFLLVDGDATLVPGVLLLESSGHVPGHQSVLVHLPQTGPVLLAIDALPFHTHTDPTTRPIEPVDVDETQVRESTRKLRAVEQREGVALTIYGHDSEQWRHALKLLPAYYA
jgi:N-acyl homoserine lactone hydrolase